MWHPPWPNDRTTRLQREVLLTDVEPAFAFEGVELLALVVMQVTRRSAFLVERVLDDEEAAIRIAVDSLKSSALTPRP